jgi:subtilisin family serine protease
MTVMNFRAFKSRSTIVSWLERWVGDHQAAWVAAWCALALGLFASAASAGPYIWDTDEDKVDDRIETVNLLGYSYSFEEGDTLLRQRFLVTRIPGDLVYGVYVVWDHEPTSADIASLTLLGMPVLYRIQAVPAVRSIATFPQIQAAAQLPGVERVESVPLLYPSVRDGLAAIGARDPSGRVSPCWSTTRPEDGHGVVLAFLDTGINDAPDGSYPGHESLIGRCVGGAEILYGDSTLDTPKSGSVNPVDRGGSFTGAHGTHVAAIAVGSGGPTAFARGVAPGASFVDVKALSDAGRGSALPEALDWCIANRARDWGSPNPDVRGIDVINLSLSSIDQTDGNDLASRLARRAVELGVIVVASMGNEGRVGEAPSPAGGDGVLAVGAWDVQRTGNAADDRYPTFNTYGPRASDQDGDAFDEMKPDLLAPGMAVLSADGDLGSDGTRYRRASGTSMAAAFVSGVAALMRSATPSLTASQITTLLRATARRDLAGLPPGATGPDVRWYAPRGFGVVDLYAAEREELAPQHTQVRRLVLSGTTSTVDVELWTMRERDVTRLVFERADDVGGAPGAFAAIDSVVAVGDSSLADVGNLTRYARAWSVPPGEYGATRWYRVTWVENGVRFETPSRSLTLPTGPSAATVEVTIAHDAYDHDVEAWIEPLEGATPVGGISSQNAPSFPLPASTAAEGSDWVAGTSSSGTQAWRFKVEIPAGAADAFLPPSDERPWALRVHDGGFVNRAGRVLEYRLTSHGPSGDTVFEGGPLPSVTIEGQTISVYLPQGSVGVGDRIATSRVIAGPNPARSGSTVTFSTASSVASEITLYDVAGRRVGSASLAPSGDGRRLGRWAVRDEQGRPLSAGVYLARCGRDASIRIAVLPQ